MEIRVLGCHGSQIAGYGLTGFLIDSKTLLDAGAVTSALTLEEQAGVENILLTHAHLDHIRELASLVDNIGYFNRDHPLTVVAPPLCDRDAQEAHLQRRHLARFFRHPQCKEAGYAVSRHPTGRKAANRPTQRHRHPGQSQGGDGRLCSGNGG
ncbi:MAG: MBL fold metallo-hydrolase [Proteobacteria bacterium]|nr:MBL fold metallo-hydrolase [Pseudomonadota bacterium]